MHLAAAEPDPVAPYAPQPPRLLDRVRDRIRVKHYSIRTEQSYLDWVRRYIRFHGLRHPSELGAEAVEQFLTDLAVRGNVAPSTQNQAKSALLFLYKEVLGVDLPWLDGVVTAKRTPRLPVVLTQAETARLLDQMTGTPGLVARLLYGTGMRILEGMRLRVKDLDLARGEILVRDGKGAKDRVTMVPRSIEPLLDLQLGVAKARHSKDLIDGVGAVYLPHALDRKYPNASREWAWQYVEARSIPRRRIPGLPTSSKRRRQAVRMMTACRCAFGRLKVSVGGAACHHVLPDKGR